MRSVQFGGEVVAMIPTIDEMATSEKSDVWWNKTDLCQFACQAESLVRAFYATGRHDMKTCETWFNVRGHTLRGLEEFEPDQEPIHKAVTKCVRQVLAEQTRQSIAQESNDRRIALASLSVSGEFRSMAQRRGIQDATAILEETNKSDGSVDLKLDGLQLRRLARILKRIEPLPEEVANVEHNQNVAPVKAHRNRLKRAVKKVMGITSLRRK